MGRIRQRHRPARQQRNVLPLPAPPRTSTRDQLVERLAICLACPECELRRTQRALFGMLCSFDIPPWRDARRCCVTAEIWTCTGCMYTW
jgi:hypothetical protein